MGTYLIESLGMRDYRGAKTNTNKPEIHPEANFSSKRDLLPDARYL